MEGVSWEAMVLRERLAHLDSLVNGHAPLYETDVVAYNKEAAFAYGRLREAWETLIERELLNETVLRHGIDVQTQRIMQVDVRDEDCLRINAGMSKCSAWITGHDKSPALNVNRPSPDELRSDIQELRDFAHEIRKYREEVRERRKAILEPQASDLG